MLRALVLLFASARLARFVTTDWLGEWTIVAPIKAWAAPIEMKARDDEFLAYGTQSWQENGPLTWPGRIAHSLDCPFCSGFWLGALMLLLEVLPKPFIVQGAWKLLRNSLAMNYVVGHVVTRLDMA